MDCLGPFSAAMLRCHGVLYPSNTFLHLPLLDAARGGTLLTGFGGDEVFALWRWSYHADLLARRRRPTLRDPVRFAHAVLPATLRRRRERRRWRWSEDLPWLRPEVARAVTELAFAARADQPRSWSRWLEWLRHRRTLCAARWSLSLLAGDADALLLDPLLDAKFLAAVASAGGRLGLGDRTAALRAIFGKLLPEYVLSRTTKSNYHEAFWGRRSREFVASWDGSGVDGELVYPAALKREWLKPNPHRASAMLLQLAWSSQRAQGGVAQIAYDPARGRDQGSRGK
jgi:asparagine synthase (glutamine-hydrolysing)